MARQLPKRQGWHGALRSLSRHPRGVASIHSEFGCDVRDAVGVKGGAQKRNNFGMGQTGMNAAERRFGKVPGVHRVVQKQKRLEPLIERRPAQHAANRRKRQGEESHGEHGPLDGELG